LFWTPLTFIDKKKNSWDILQNVWRRKSDCRFGTTWV